MREQVESIVSSVVGSGRARVQLTADFDFNRITQTSDKFDPEGRVVRSSQTARRIQPRPPTNSGQVSVGNELPGASNNGPAAPAARDQSKKTEEIVNYEISRTTKTEVIEGGRVNRISVAVLVDGIYGKNDKGEMTYQPRSKEEIDRIAALVRTAIGFDAEARRPGRGRQSALRRSAGDAPISRADRLARHAAVHQGRHHARRRARRDGAARPGRAVPGGAAAGAPHPRARSDRPRSPRRCRRRAGALHRRQRRRAGSGPESPAPDASRAT